MPSEGSVLRLPVGNGLECAVFCQFPRAAFGLGKQCGGFRVGFGDVGEADDTEVVGVVGVFVGLVAAEETPAAVVFKNGGFAVEEADRLVLFGVLVAMQRSSAEESACANAFIAGIRWGKTYGFYHDSCVVGRRRRFGGTMCAVCSLKVFLYF